MVMTLIHALLILITDCYLSIQFIKHKKKSVSIQLKLLINLEGHYSCNTFYAHTTKS